MDKAGQADPLKSLDRIIEQLENKLKESRRTVSLITSQPDQNSLLVSLSLKGLKP